MIRPAIAIAITLTLAACSDAAPPAEPEPQAVPPPPTTEEPTTLPPPSIAGVNGPVGRRFVPVADQGETKVFPLEHDYDMDSAARGFSQHGQIVTAALTDEDRGMIVLVAARASSSATEVVHVKTDKNEIAASVARLAQTGVAVTAIATYSSKAHLFGVKVAGRVEPMIERVPVEQTNVIALRFAQKGFVVSAIAREYGGWTAVGYREQDQGLEQLTFSEHARDVPRLLEKLSASKYMVSGATSDGDDIVSLHAFRGHQTYRSRADLVKSLEQAGELGKKGWVVTSAVKVADGYVLVSTR